MPSVSSASFPRHEPVPSDYVHPTTGHKPEIALPGLGRRLGQQVLLSGTCHRHNPGEQWFRDSEIHPPLSVGGGGWGRLCIYSRRGHCSFTRLRVSCTSSRVWMMLEDLETLTLGFRPHCAKPDFAGHGPLRKIDMVANQRCDSGSKYSPKTRLFASPPNLRFGSRIAVGQSLSLPP